MAREHLSPITAAQAHIPVTPHGSIRPTDTRHLPFRPDALTTLPYYIAPSYLDNHEPPRGAFINRRMPGPHARSSELTTDPAGLHPTRVIFGDDHDRWYSVLNVKGNNSVDPRARYTAQTPTGYDIEGLALSDTIARQIRASEALQQLDLDAEWDISVVLPEHLSTPTHVGPATIEEVLEYARQNHKKVTTTSTPQRSVHGAFATYRPVSILRAFKISERLYDMNHIDAHSKHNIVRDCIRLHNFDITTRTKHGSLGNRSMLGADVILDPDTDAAYYVEYVLPRRIAHNVATLHNVGISAGSMHSANITLFGELADLDTFRGSKIWQHEDDATIHDRLSDITSLFSNETWIGELGLSTTYAKEKFKIDFYNAYRTIRLIPESGIEALCLKSAMNIGVDIEELFDDEGIEDLKHSIGVIIAAIQSHNNNPDVTDAVLTELITRHDHDDLANSLNEGRTYTASEPRDTFTTAEMLQSLRYRYCRLLMERVQVASQ